MFKKTASVESVDSPSLEKFVSDKLKSGQNKSDQLRKFWDDFNFQLGPSGLKLKTEIGLKFYQNTYIIKWDSDRNVFLEDIDILPIDLEIKEDLKVGYLYAVYNITKNALLADLQKKFKDRKKAIDDTQSELDAARRPLSPKRTKEKRGVVSISAEELKKIEIKLAGHNSALEGIKTQMKAFKDRMLEIKDSMDRSTMKLNSPTSSPRATTIIGAKKDSVGSANTSPSTSPRSTAFGLVSTKTRVQSVTSVKSGLSPVGSASTSPSTSPRSTAFSMVSTSSKVPSASTRPTTSTGTSGFGMVSTSPRVQSVVTSSRRFTIGSRKPVTKVEETETIPGAAPQSGDKPLESPKPVPKVEETSPRVTSQSGDLTLGSPKPTKKLPPLPSIEAPAPGSKRDTVTLPRESVMGISPDSPNLGRGSVPLILETRGSGDPLLDLLFEPGREASFAPQPQLGVGRGTEKPVRIGSGRGRGRGRVVSTESRALKENLGISEPVKRPPPPEISPHSLVSSGEKPVIAQPVAGPRPSQSSEGNKTKSGSVVFPKKAAVPKTFLPRPESGLLRPIITLSPREGSEGEKEGRLPLPNLRLGNKRPKPAARIAKIGKGTEKEAVEKISQIVAAAVVESLHQDPEPREDDLSRVPVKKPVQELFAEDDDEYEIAPTLVGSCPEGTEGGDPKVDDQPPPSAFGTSPLGEEEIPSTSPRKDDTVDDDTDSGEKARHTDDDASGVESELASHHPVESSESEEKDTVKETPRTTAAKALPQDKASKVLNAIISPNGYSKAKARQEYKTKQYEAFNQVLNKFKDLESSPSEQSFLFEEENEPLRKGLGDLFDHLIVLQTEKLEWEKIPATYHVKKNPEDKVEGVIELFSDLANPKYSLADLKAKLELILGSTEDKGLLQNRTTGAFVIGSFFRREKNPVNKQYIRSTTERRLVEIYNTISAALKAEHDESQADEVEPSAADTTKNSH